MTSFFPAELKKDFAVVWNAIPKRTFHDCPDWFSEESMEYTLADNTISIPYRCYLLEPPESNISKLTEVQQQILFCLYTRSSDGYLREKYVRRLLSSVYEAWAIPYIVKLCDEYVVEILYVIYNSLREKPNEEIKSFCMANRRTIWKSYARMISYWNEYYRADCFNLKAYVGRKLFRECLGYSRAFEKTVGSVNTMTEKEKALAGLEFIRGDKELKARRDRAEELCFRYNSTSPADAEARSALLRELIPCAGENCTIKSPFSCDYGDFIRLGKNFFSNYNVKLIDGGPITFGDNVMVGPDCTFVTPTHAVEPDRRLAGYMQYLPITVGNNVWFGAGVTVCGGVTIGDNAVIGAGSVVVKDIPANCLAAGNPCKVIRKVDE